MNRPQTIRAFIAIHLPEAVTSALDGVNKALATVAPPGSVRWVKPEAMHLTLRFLGDTAVSHIPLLAAALDRIGAQHIPLHLTLGQVGYFPNRKRPRVIWIGLEGDVPALQQLQAGIEDAVVALGWAREERPFRPHLTLGRVKDNRQLAAVQWQADVKPLPVPVTAVYLMQSDLRPSGPLYTIGHSSRLGH